MTKNVRNNHENLYEKTKRNKTFKQDFLNCDLHSRPENNKFNNPLYLNQLKNESPSQKKLTFKSFFKVNSSNNSSWKIKNILIASYMIETEWVINELIEENIFELNEIEHLLFICSNQHENLNNLNCFRNLNIARDIQLYSPYLKIPYGVFHPKFMLIIFENFKNNQKDFVRFVITSANFLKEDWENKSQSIWVQDFFKSEIKNELKCEFKFYFLEFLQHIFSNSKYRQFWVDKISEFNFDDATVKLIASVPGYFQDIKQVNKWGHLRVKSLIKEVQNKICQTEYNSFNKDDGKFILQFSSLGKISEKWFYQEFASSLSEINIKYFKNYEKKFQVVFPTVQQVINSQEGILGGASIPVKYEYINKPWIKKLLHKWGTESLKNDVCTYEVIPHIKTFIKYQLIDNYTPQIIWIIQGSHNLSTAAWGQFQKDKTQFCIRNYELGIFIHKDSFCYECYFEDTEEDKGPRFLWKKMANFSNSVNTLASTKDSLNVLLPFDIPPKPYLDEDEPWFIELLIEK